MIPLPVAIDARLPDSGQGGVQHVVKSLAQGMAMIDSSLLRRRWLVYRGTNWWQSALPPGDSVVEINPPAGKFSVGFAQRHPQVTSRLYPLIASVLAHTSTAANPSLLGDARVFHAPFQDGLRSNLPLVYNPHDLQHLHFPNNFSRAQIRHRETYWRGLAKQATVVMAASNLVKADLHDRWNIQQENIVVIPVPPPINSDAENSTLHHFTYPYFYYPAAFWPHKNHKTLLEATALLKSRGQNVTVVLSGAAGSAHTQVMRAIHELKLSDSVHVLGHIADADVASLIRNALGIVIPSLFEAMSLVVWEAQRVGTPVACSNVGSFPEQVGDSAITFNPRNPDDIAAAMLNLSRNSNLRRVLGARGEQRTKDLTPRNYALAMSGIYYQAAGEQAPTETVLARHKLTDAMS